MKKAGFSTHMHNYFAYGDSTGQPYNAPRIINDDVSFDLEAYQAYNPLVLYAPSPSHRALISVDTATLMIHPFLYYRKHAWIYARRSLVQQPDIHTRLVYVYKEVPRLVVSNNIRSIGPIISALLALCT